MLIILDTNKAELVQNKELLKIALTHTSYAYENGVESNEKLEFLGDSILEFISSEYLFENFEKIENVGTLEEVRKPAKPPDAHTL
mgnify:CR=1 FL=1